MEPSYIEIVLAVIAALFCGCLKQPPTVIENPPEPMEQHDINDKPDDLSDLL